MTDAAIRSFLAAWNHRDPAALGRLFTVNGKLDMATKHQGTARDRVWARVGASAPAPAR
jgi:hypothetical protein